MSGRGNKDSRQAAAGYWGAARTVICPYCNTIRSVENIVQRTPRIKCKVCASKAAGFKSA